MKLFKSIVQFDAAKLQGGGGSGLGLWSKCQNKMQSHPAYFDCDCLVSKAIMSAHGGQLWVTSTVFPVKAACSEWS
jgi:hypothetical protein